MTQGSRMRAAVYHGPGDIRLADQPMPTPRPDEVLLKVAAVGICGTDAHEYVSGPHVYPGAGFIPGHEFAGVVVEVGETVEGLAVGDLVTSGAGISCGVCDWCRSGKTNHCKAYLTYGLQLPGALAQFVVVPARICFDVGGLGLSPDFAALAQPMSIAVHALRRGRVEPGETSVVVGAGGIGSFLTYALAAAGSPPAVLDLDPERLHIAEGLGASVTSQPGNDLGEPFWGPSVVFEVTGSHKGLEKAISLAGPRTRVVLVGLQSHHAQLDLRDVSLREMELLGTNAHTFTSDFPWAVHLLANRKGGWSDVAPLAIPLESLVDEGLVPMVEDRARPIKTLIDPWASDRRSAGSGVTPG